MKPSTTFPTPDAWLEHRVSYGETDAMGVVYYANYLHWFEMSRSLYIRELGMSYRLIEERGIFLPVRQASCRYVAPARFDQLVQIHAAISTWTRASLTFVYEVTDSHKTRVLATGSTQHAVVDPHGKPCRVPHWLWELCT
ncbi:acyl-CoA thioesterase [Desulfoplanes formicivorans]|uniref:Thioesterase n=1 Tax=Desulfoplanes formicivorans TaxID=1592317 RepID=A0A194AE56_9BACT|nr:thioesterase family protein [Desulfoplanes formicivorans]GAU08362.1 thioesterase [Desulfoplanes formicivorans]